MYQQGSNDVLRLLSDPELEELLQLYALKSGIGSFQYLLIYTQLQWNKKLREKHIDEQDEKWISFRKKFYTHVNGDFRKYGTYVCLHQDLVSIFVF